MQYTEDRLRLKNVRLSIAILFYNQEINIHLRNLMSFESISMKKLALIIIAAGVVIVFVLSGFSAGNLFRASITEEAKVLFKNQDGTCVVEGSDQVPRNISDCPYNEGDTVQITYKPEQPAIERHELVKKGASDGQ